MGDPYTGIQPEICAHRFPIISSESGAFYTFVLWLNCDDLGGDDAYAKHLFGLANG